MHGIERQLSVRKGSAMPSKKKGEARQVTEEQDMAAHDKPRQLEVQGSAR